jgi:hypothetical protein
MKASGPLNSFPGLALDRHPTGICRASHLEHFGPCNARNPAGLAVMQIANAERLCPQLTCKKYSGDHWIMWSHADQLNPDLLAWVEGLPKKSAL